MSNCLGRGVGKRMINYLFRTMRMRIRKCLVRTFLLNRVKLRMYIKNLLVQRLGKKKMISNCLVRGVGKRMTKCLMRGRRMRIKNCLVKKVGYVYFPVHKGENEDGN